MAEIIIGAIIFGVVIAVMAVGVMFGRKPISGSCGGVGKALGQDNYVCDLCGNDPNKCEEQSDSKELGYDASR